MSTNTKYMAIIAVVIIIVAGIVVATNGSFDSDGGETITIIQNNGVEVEVPTPVTKVCVVNTSAAEFLSIVGLSDKVVGVSSSMIKSPVEPWWADRTDIGSWKTPNAESILETGATIVIGQCTSMAISNVEALQAQGITVILLDCYGYDTQASDLKQLVSIFENDKANALVDKYEDFFNNISNIMRAASSNITDDQKMTFISSMGVDAKSKYYTGASELSSMLGVMCGMKNAIAEIDSSIASSSSEIQEADIVEYYNESGIDLFILRKDAQYSDEGSSIITFLSTHILIEKSVMLDEIRVVHVVDTKALSGPRCFIGMIYFASIHESLDIEGLTMEDSISQYNDLFGTNWSTEESFYEYT